MTTTLDASSRVDFEWVACAGCRELVYGRRFARLLRVCPGCGFHDRLTSPQRMGQLLDPGTAQLLDTPATVEDPLAFTDTRPYRERLREARARTSLDEAVLCARGTIAGYPLVVAIMDFRFLGGSLGCAVGERITCAAEAALRERVALLLVTASGGARMQEGALSLMQMVKISQALAMLDEAAIMTIALITDPTYGGVAASFATLPDVILAEPGAHVGFAGPRVIQQTIGQRLPEGFQTAEFVFSHGLIDGVTSRAGLRATLARLLEGQRQTPPPPPPQPAGLIHDPDQLPVRNPWEVLQLARRPDRPTTLDYVEHILDDFQELHGDRLSGDCPAIVGGVGRLDGRAVMLIGHQKGHSTRERMARNFGMPTPTGYRKAARLMRLAAKLALPVVTLIDTPGAYPGVDAEERGQAWAIAENLRLMSWLPVPVVAMVTGEGGSGGALALGVANCVLALSNAVYSVISPEGCAAILWKSPEAAPQAAAALGLDSRELLRQGVVDAVVPEPEGGAHTDPAATACLVRAALSESLHRLARTDPRELVAQRRRRFRIMGCRRPEEG